MTLSSLIHDIDYAMAKKVVHNLKNHLWYLVEETAPLSLFSYIVSEDVKDRIRCRSQP